MQNTAKQTIGKVALLSVFAIRHTSLVTNEALHD